MTRQALYGRLVGVESIAKPGNTTFVRLQMRLIKHQVSKGGTLSDDQKLVLAYRKPVFDRA